MKVQRDKKGNKFFLVQWVCPYFFLGVKKKKKKYNDNNNDEYVKQWIQNRKRIHSPNKHSSKCGTKWNLHHSLSLFLYTPNQLTNKTRGVSHCSLAIYIKKYLKAKDKLWKFKYVTLQKYNLPKKCFNRDQNPSRYQNSITNFKFQHKPKYHLSKILISK